MLPAPAPPPPKYLPFGAKGVGEIGLVTVPAAISNAILNASDIHLRKLPMTSERVFHALRRNEELHAA